MTRRYDEPKIAGHEHRWFSMDWIGVAREHQKCAGCGWSRWREDAMAAPDSPGSEDVMLVDVSSLGPWLYVAPGDDTRPPPARGREVVVWLDPKADPPPFRTARGNPLLGWVRYAGGGAGSEFWLGLHRSNGEWVVPRGKQRIALPTTIEVLAWSESLRGPWPDGEEAADA
jgi:hypothetical protein